MFKLLVVEDDKDLNRSVCSFLNQTLAPRNESMDKDPKLRPLYLAQKPKGRIK